MKKRRKQERFKRNRALLPVFVETAVCQEELREIMWKKVTMVWGVTSLSYHMVSSVLSHPALLAHATVFAPLWIRTL